MYHKGLGDARDAGVHGRDRATRDLPGITSHYPRSSQQPGRYAGVLERAWMAGVASNNGKFHVQQAQLTCRNCPE
ncbi:jg4445 [Pararge aegeria aegeria]|uniref:Jg4445 protein n=1 Tax=Pararge aegeria aegeria TaxID=348720 RepID=A0A8S4S1D1_9NEOP|nr:jg4445 [Pararge aegeria aegeria]